ncbi:hypothetical protein GRI32_00065 [Altererythrobacter aestuarii]|uniref:NlpC/P60 domain-containing protein n=1 Tax=Alteraurantiacibacter aestuarii TaxID=650004 RepID=A0A844ZJE2_9SPHN|nr:hypothetical protein [Alteraurantiacibacter aestuarii]
MTCGAADFARAAQELTGSPFLLHGRDPATGLDCIGLVTSALRKIGRRISVCTDYRLRNLDISHLLPAIDQAGFMSAHGPCQPGDLVLLKTAPGQFHLAVAALEGGFVHAHAGLGRVVHTPAPLAWPTIGHWRLPQS